MYICINYSNNFSVNNRVVKTGAREPKIAESSSPGVSSPRKMALLGEKGLLSS